MTEYVVYDVFTDTAFGGNPLAVIPDASALEEGVLQRIAREFGFSETTLVYPGEVHGRYQVRIFTPTTEIPFAGHPTVGTALALVDRGAPVEMVFEMGVGEIPVSVTDGVARFVTTHPLDRIRDVAAEDIALCLGIDEGALAGRPLQASVGLPFALAELTDLAALGAIVTKTEEFERCHTLYPTPFDFAVMAYVRQDAAIRARMFAPLDNIPEDPATGSAAAALGGLLAENAGESARFTILQGIEMGRPSEIGVDVTLGGDGKAESIGVSGRAARVMEGRLIL